ncbi:unnamed protein product [Gongylonema pulchrum]|uniref:Uncharacterized protein n=1 Tax=Gongylonema pulchrum TaxID=637853 RepID=A0A183EXM0_9BILA|nr:unnamed protein product [Gongylonema pulchrum]
MNAPNFLVYKIFEMRLSETCNITDERNRDAPAYIPGVSDLAVKAHCLVILPVLMLLFAEIQFCSSNNITDVAA